MQHIPLHLLEPHPQALMCAGLADGEERAAADAAIAASVKTDGVKVPLVVAPKDDRSGFWVLDGCSRLAAAKAAGLDAVPASISPAKSECDIGEEIYRRNALRKPFTSSQRIMLYVNIHLGEILENDRSKGGRPKLGEDAPGFSANAIADRIGVDRHDVAAAIELCRCENARLVPDRITGDLRDVANEEEAGRLDSVYACVMHGSTPVRRWRPAYEGMAVGEGGSAVNYVRLGLRTVKSLRTVFTGWQEISPADRQPVLDILREALESAPDDVVYLLRNRIERNS